MTLLGQDRVRFESRRGWDEQQVGRDVAFCSTTDPRTVARWTIPDALAELENLADLAELVLHEIELRSATRRALFSDR